MSATDQATTHRAAPTPSLEVPGKYLSLTTYRRDGSPVSTPVWFVEDEGRLFVTTAVDSYKARRLRHNPAAMVAPCTARGVAKGDAVPVHVKFLPEADHARVDALMAEKYGIDKILVLPVYRLVTKLRGKASGESETAYLAITGT
jgi:PPOX class probable F420-dependent enzyme